MLGLRLCPLCPLAFNGIHLSGDASATGIGPDFLFPGPQGRTNTRTNADIDRGEPIAGFVRVHNTTIDKEAHDTIFKMASMNFSSGKQFVKPPQRGIFPLDHDAECKPKMQVSSMVVWRAFRFARRMM